MDGKQLRAKALELALANLGNSATEENVEELAKKIYKILYLGYETFVKTGKMSKYPEKRPSIQGDHLPGL